MFAPTYMAAVSTKVWGRVSTTGANATMTTSFDKKMDAPAAIARIYSGWPPIRAAAAAVTPVAVHTAAYAAYAPISASAGTAELTAET